MPRLSCARYRLLRRSALATASALALLGSQATVADSSITVGVNSWLGSSDTDWFHSANWWGGQVFNLPDSIFPVYFGPVQLIVNGVPTNMYDRPSSEAVLRSAFSTSSLDMRAWDGISQIRLESGALLTAGSATIGQLHTVYQPSGPIQKATLVLAGGQIAGSLSFYTQSKVVVSALYGTPLGQWSGTLGELQIDSGAGLSLPVGSLTVGQISNAGDMKLASGGNLTVSGTVHNTGTFTVGGSGTIASASLYLAGNTTLSGNGSTVLTDANYSNVGGTGLLTVGQGHTLRGSGYVAVNIANQSKVIADGVLTVNAGNKSFDNSSGLVQVANAGTLSLSGGTFSGGTLQGLGTDSRLGGSGTFQNLALSGPLQLTGGTTLDTVSSTGQLFLGAGHSVSTKGTLTNTGTLTIGGSGNIASASLYVAGNTTLAGNGSTILTDANYSNVGGSGALTVGQGHTLRGSGYVAVNIVNQSKVIADGVLTVNAANKSFDNSSGLVQVANAGVLSLSGGSFSGGVLQGLGTGSRLGGSGTFQSLVLSGPLQLTGGTTLDSVINTGQLVLGAGHSVSTKGNITNTGTLTVGGSGNVASASVYVVGNTTLAGNGSTILTDANYSYVGGTGLLTVGEGHTLRGSGYVAANVANQSTVIADGTLTVNAGGKYFDNSRGLVQVANAGMLSLSGGIFSGGALQGLSSGSRLGGNGTFQNLVLSGPLQLTGGTTLDSVTNTGQLYLGAGHSVSTKGTISNSGTLTIGGSGNIASANLYLAGNTTLAGSGSTVLTDANYSYVGGTGVLTIGHNQTLRGRGYVAVNMANQGKVIADGMLTVNASNKSFDNSAGLVQVAEAGMLSLSGGTFSGGTLQGLGTDSRLGGGGTFQNIALEGTWQAASSTPLNLAGTVNNAGTLTVRGSGNTGTASLNISSNTTLAGNGSTVLTDANYSTVSGSSTLTVAQGHTLRGSGYVAVGVVNQGSVVADGVLTVNAGTGKNFNNSNSAVQVGNAGMLSVAGGTFSGGTLHGLGAGSRLGGNGTLQNVALTGQLNLTGGTTLESVLSTAQLILAGGNSVTTRGTLTNEGSLTVTGSGNTGTAAIYLASDTTLAGSGNTVLTDANYSYVGGAGVLKVSQGHTLRGSGYIAASLANQGKVIADGMLSVNAASGKTFDNSGGLVQVADAGLLSLSGATLSGGTVQGLGAGSRIGGGGTFQNVTLQGTFQIAANNPLNLADTVTNHGTLTIKGSANTGAAVVHLAGNTTLGGSGSTVLTDANYSTISGNGALTIAQGHTLTGTGYVTTKLTNQGTVQVGSNDVLTVTGGSLLNQGQLLVSANGTLNAGTVTSGYVQDSVSAVTTVDGLLQARSFQLEAGTLKGSGTIQADVTNLGGTIAAGNSPGTLSVDGNLTLGADSLLVVEVAGLLQGVQYDWLKVAGNVTLGGSLQFDFGSYKPKIGETYNFLTSGNGFIGGTFANALSNGYELTLNYGSNGIIAKVSSVSAVPEPATYGLMMLGLGVLGAYARRRRA